MRSFHRKAIRLYLASVLAAVAVLHLLSAKAFAEDAKATTDNDVQVCNARQSDFSILLRNDFTDLGPLSCTHGLVGSQGATFSWTHNLLTNQNSASADGLLALDYTWYNGEGVFVKGFSIGPYIQFDDTYQFQPTGTQLYNGYTLTPGGFVELALWNQFGLGIDNFRVREGGVFVNTGTTSDSFVGEWIPVYQLGRYRNLGLPNQLGSSALWYTFSPELMVQYDHFDSGSKTAAIFASGVEALRIGPQAMLQLVIDQNSLPSGWPAALRAFFGNSSVILTNHESWDQYTGKEYSWTAVSYNYTFPGADKQPSHLGLSASYGFGNMESSGNFAKQVKLGLAAKF
jgi:hypothetical protein